MIRRAWAYWWADLALYEEAPHPARCLLWLGVAALLSLTVWTGAVLFLAALA
jgi:hypothetical protein